MHHQNIILDHASAFTLQEPCMVVDGGRSEEEWDGTGRRGSGGEIREDSSRSSDPRIGFSPRPERALGWWELRPCIRRTSGHGKSPSLSLATARKPGWG